MSNGTVTRLTTHHLDNACVFGFQSDCLYACGTALSAQPSASSATDLSPRLLPLLERLWATMPTQLTGPAGTRLAVGLIRATAAVMTANQQLFNDQQLARVSGQRSGVRVSGNCQGISV